MKTKLFLLMVSTLLFYKQTMAQCDLKKTVTHSAVTISTGEIYLYNRSAADYHAVAIKLLSVQKLSQIKILGHIQYTTTNSLEEPKTALIKFSDGETVELLLKFNNRTIADSKDLVNKVFIIEPDAKTINMLQLVTVDYMAIMNPLGKVLNQFAFTDKAALQQGLTCLNAQHPN